MNAENLAYEYHHNLNEGIQEKQPKTISEIGACCVEAAQKTRSTTDNKCSRPEQSEELKNLIYRRHRTRDTQERRQLSKMIAKQTRRELRAWRTLWAEFLLDKMKDVKHTQKINTDSIQKIVCPSEADDLSEFLEELFHSDHPLCAEPQIIGITFPRFSLDEFEKVATELSNMKRADD